MNVLELVQEAARRLGIMIPSSINATGIDTDYDANLLNAYLRSTIRQNTEFSNLRKLIRRHVIHLDDPGIEIYSNNEFQYPILEDLPDFDALEGDGFNLRIFDEDNNIKDQFLFRSLTSTDYMRIARNKNFEGEDSFNFYEKIKTIERDAPSERQQDVIKAKNLESGFYLLSGIDPGNLIYRFCYNHGELPENKELASLSFLYKTKYVVIGSDGLFKELPSNNMDTVSLPDELLILGIVINFKNFHGLDTAMDLAQYKSLIDALKVNQDHVQVARMDRKVYIGHK